MLNGLLRALLAAAKYLNSQIAISGGNTPATQGDLDVIKLGYSLPATLNDLLSAVEGEIDEAYLKIEELIGKDYWDAIINEYDKTLTQYLSKKPKNRLTP